MNQSAKEVRDCKDPVTVGLVPKHIDLIQRLLIFGEILGFEAEDLNELAEVLNDSIRNHDEKYNVVCSCDHEKDGPAPSVQSVSFNAGSPGTAGWNRRGTVVVSCNPEPTSLEDI